MLDLRFIRANPEMVREAMKKKKMEADLDRLLELDERRRNLLVDVEALKARRNTVSEEIGRLKKAGGHPEELIQEMRQVSDRIKEMDEEIRRAEEGMEEILAWIPNLPHESVPVGECEEQNREVRRWGTPRAFDFEPKAHWDLGVELDILDFERASRLSGTRFPLYKGAGARLERALINFMLDLHTEEHGYREIFPPFMVTRDCMYGTGQLPKLEEDMFKVAGKDFYLIPTAEVPVTNMHREEIIPGEKLPLYYVAYSACFRAEAGAAGRDTRGLIRVHQFNKVELVKFTPPETSYEELEKLVADAEDVLRRLELPYRVMILCTADMSFASSKTYDIEVWLPSYNAYKEISSCSNFEDFQARRAGIRFRPEGGGKARFVHTLNGSGVAIGRTVAAVLENYQQPDGTVRVPGVLKPYMGGLEVIARP